MLKTVMMVVSLVMPSGQEQIQEQYTTTMESCLNIMRRYDYIEAQRRTPAEMQKPFVRIQCNVI